MGHNPICISCLSWWLIPSQTELVTAHLWRHCGFPKAIRIRCVADLDRVRRGSRRETSGPQKNNVGLHGARKTSLPWLYAWLWPEREIKWAPRSSFGFLFRAGSARGLSRKVTNCLHHGSVRRNSGNFGKGRKLHYSILWIVCGLFEFNTEVLAVSFRLSSNNTTSC